MSNFQGHNLVGIGSASLVVSVGYVLSTRFSLAPLQVIGGGLITYLFALFPDLDTKSTPSKVFYGVMLCVLGFLAVRGCYQQATLLAMVAMIPQVLSHRGALHSVLASILIPAALLILVYARVTTPSVGFFWFGCGVWGYWTHLVLD